ncbi:hypothetical protein Hrd1104_03210 [Halorhabdus sp. CBA1104]|uniref:DUF7524 family protein n=1 Tax=unclassified Halorhabdus TaxID=2621901 RepID=UPI0012B33635|nr:MULTISPECIES: hypothetical protein [unclassified Halorhabdus]QGN06400.1 hypothetical protein Hrd1104_03210 [Halorhabdus sp. CBA1104]
MADPLPVHVNREQLHDLGVPPSYETTGTFPIRLINHGEPSHVHLHLDDSLSDVARLEATNHYVDGNHERFVTVSVQDGVTQRGKLKIVSGYGATTRYVDIVLTEPEEANGSVTVDESLAHPQPTEPESTDSVFEASPALPVIGLALVALVFALAVAVLLKQFVVAVGAVAVLIGVLVAGYVLVFE